MRHKATLYVRRFFPFFFFRFAKPDRTVVIIESVFFSPNVYAICASSVYAFDRIYVPFGFVSELEMHSHVDIK